MDAETDGSEGGSGADDEDVWLTRAVAQALQRDFGALYDYLVNRDVIWDGSEFRSGRKWVMVSESGNKSFSAEDPSVPMTDMLIEFDNKLRFPHIPHPFPLIPESIPPTSAPSQPSPKESSMFKSRKQSSTPGPSRVGNMERRVHLAYTESTNIYILGSDLTQSDLIDAFVRFEKSDKVGEVDPAVARRGRWVIIYGILQTLASVSVDAPNVRYRDNVPYHLSPSLKGAKVPPWRNQGGDGKKEEACHELSHCWVVARGWGEVKSSDESSEDAERSVGMGGTGEKNGKGSAKGLRSARSSVVGYHTPATRSVKSAGGVSVSRGSEDSGSFVRRVRSRENVRAPGSAHGSVRGGGFDRLEEIDFAARKRDFSSAAGGASASGSGGGKIPMSGGVTGSGGFMMLDGMLEEPEGTVIRDFDEGVRS